MNILRQLWRKEIAKSKRRVTDYLKQRNLNYFFLKPVNEKEIQNIISNTANNKAVGPNCSKLSIKTI